MKYPKYKDYENMYKRYFKKGVDYLLKYADLKSTDKVLDICGGNGRLTLKLKELVDNVSYLDQEKDMIPKKLNDLGITVYNTSVQEFVNTTVNKYDKIFCEQAVNYWLLDTDIKAFSNLLNKNGLFIFNTFSKRPTEKPMLKEYTIDNINYLEISYLVNNMVEHIQICENYKPHFTEFAWISETDFRNLLSPYFNITVHDDGKSALYICQKK